jgi:hypothetical protein
LPSWAKICCRFHLFDNENQYKEMPSLISVFVIRTLQGVHTRVQERDLLTELTTVLNCRDGEHFGSTTTTERILAPFRAESQTDQSWEPYNHRAHSCRILSGVTDISVLGIKNAGITDHQSWEHKHTSWQTRDGHAFLVYYDTAITHSPFLKGNYVAGEFNTCPSMQA